MIIPALVWIVSCTAEPSLDVRAIRRWADSFISIDSFPS